MSRDNPFSSEQGRQLRKWSILLLTLWFTVVMFVGMLGYTKLEVQQSQELPCGAIAEASQPSAVQFWKQVPSLNHFYLALQLFLLHSEYVENCVPGTLQFARILAAGVEVIGVFYLFGALVVPRLVWLREWSFRYRTDDHFVVCGLGRKGMELVRGLCENNRVVVVEKDDRNPLLAACNNLGAMVVVGDATNPETLERAGLGRAKRLIAVCGNDGTNLEISTQAEQYLSHSGVGKNVECHIHVIDLTLRSLMRKHKCLSDGRLSINIFNVFENGARQLFQCHFLDHPKAITDEDDPRQVHLIIIGFGPVGESVALQAVRLAQFPNEKKLRLTIADKMALRKRDGLLVRYDKFLTVCDAEFRQQEAEDPVLLSHIKEWSDDKNSIATIVVCFDDDAHSLSYGLTLDNMLTNPDTRIFVRIESPAGVAELLERTHEVPRRDRAKQGEESGQNQGKIREKRANMYAFGQLKHVCSDKIVVEENLNKLARSIHDKYREPRFHEPGSPDAGLKEWEKLDPDLKESNWQQADHIPCKLRAINCTMKDSVASPGEGTSEVVEEFDDCAEVLLLAKMEHRRWMTERCLAGWQWASTKSVDQRTSPYILPWDDDALPQNVKNYDVNAVKAIPKLVQVRRVKRKQSEGQPALRVEPQASESA